MTVLLHGFTGAPASFDVLAPLIAGTAHAPPLLGHGAPGPGAPSFEAEVDRLAAVIAEAVPVGARWVVGYSLGGRLALGLAVRHPSLIEGVIAVGAHPGLTDAVARAERRRADERWATLLVEAGVGAFVARWAEAPLFASQARLPAVTQEAQRRVRSSHDAEGLARSLRVLGLGAMGDLSVPLRRTPVPVHLVTGARDAKFTALAGALTASGAARSHAIVDGAGHNVVLEAPEALAAIIEAETAANTAAEPAREAPAGGPP